MENHVKEVLRRFSLDFYYEKFIEHGYDDADFLKQLTKSQIVELQNDVGMTKKGHIMRFDSALASLKVEDNDSVNASDVNRSEESPPAVPASLESVSKPSCKYEYKA